MSSVTFGPTGAAKTLFALRPLVVPPRDEPIRKRLTPFTASYDVMGDGSLVLLPTPGHTPGSMSLLVRRSVGAPLLLVGDLTYETELLEAGRIPGVGEKAGLRRASAMVRQLKERYPDLPILPAHDPGAADRLRRANASGGTADPL